MAKRGWIAAAIVVAATCVAADVYPVRSVKIVVPYAAGGSTDATGRLIAQQLGEQLGQPFVVENRTGAGSTIGNGVVARSAPDGYTLMLADQSFVLAPNLYKSLPYDIFRDFTPITEIMHQPAALVVNPSVSATTLKEFVALAQANPGKLNYGSAGIGGSIHLVSELFKRAAKVDIVHVPYSGGGGAMMSGVLAGDVQMVLTAVPTVLPYVKAGKLRALAVTTSDGKRSPALPDVPSMAEAGLPGMTVYFWYGLAGPAGLPREVVTTIRAEVQKALTAPKVRETFLAQGGEPVGSSPEEFAAHIRNEYRVWSEVIKQAGIAPE